MKNILFVLTLLSSAIFPYSATASPYPDLYPNEYLKKVGPERARRDVNDCQIAANDYTAQSGKQQSGAKKVVRGAAKGAALGALGGAIMGEAGRGTGAGAAIGGVAAVADNRREQREGSPEYRKYVEACLSDRGYSVVGWR